MDIDEDYYMSYLSSLITLLTLDGLWIWFCMRSFYLTKLNHLFAQNISLAPRYSFISYTSWDNHSCCYASTSKPLIETVITGALLGLIAYGTYDLTNQATLKDWPLIVTIVDIAWGVIVTALAATAAALSLSALMH